MGRYATILTSLLWVYLIGCGECTNANSPVFAFFESPIPGDEKFGGIGPSVWKDLFRIDHNHCGGNGQKNGFGQSPITIPYDNIVTCDRNINEYIFVEDATCTFEEIDFQVTKDGLRASVATNKDNDNEQSICHLGKLKIPGLSHVIQATEIRITNGSEHSFEGLYFNSEMQIFCRKGSHNEISAAFSLLLSPFSLIDESIIQYDKPTGNTNSFFEPYLKGWEANRDQTEEFCALNPMGTEKFVAANTAIKSQHVKICPDVASGVNLSEINFDQDGYPKLHTVNFTQGPVTSFLQNQSGYFSYKGSLTTPPCTENIHWNIATGTIILSIDQLRRIQNLILCFVERSNCQHGSAASEFLTTTRPPQPLNGRQIINYCDNYTNDNTTLTQAPENSKYEMADIIEPYYGILFPWFVCVLGFFLFYLLTRYVNELPYTAVLFLLGTIMGIGVSHHDSHNQLTNSIVMWQNINSELLLLVFLPGLLFKDGYGLDIHMFRKSFVQCLIMGFPMVLAGTCLMALVGKYILPYGWSSNFALTFGAIASATDPVAVGALLNELGAPPRLKMHISGESLLNDGSAYVFFTIFKTLYLNDINIHGGEVISVGKGFAIFFKMSLGAMALGSLFGFGLSFILYILKRRLNKEENIVQVSITITFAYLAYYVSEITLHLSGVIAVVFCSIVTKAFASHTISDQEMMSKFWALVEHLLNTILFVLGGVVWGSVISNTPNNLLHFDGKDYGYWVLVFVLMTAVRFLLFGLFYPLIRRIGLYSNKKEMIFQAFGGLRGAVGIALAIALDNEVNQATINLDPRREFSSQLFAVTGWISLSTLFINGILAGPLLRKLRLHRSSDARDKMIEHVEEHIRTDALTLLIKLLGETRFAGLDYSILNNHVKSLKLDKLTGKQLILAVRLVKESSPVHMYKEPDLSIFDGYFEEKDKETELEAVKKVAKIKMADVFRSNVRKLIQSKQVELHNAKVESSRVLEEDDEYTKEVRLVFVELLRHAYEHHMEIGRINVNEEPVVTALNRSVSITEDEVCNNNPIEDWQQCKQAIELSYIMKYHKRYNKERADAYTVHLTSAFISAHEEAQEIFMSRFCKVGHITNAEGKVLDESSQQISLAENWLNEGVEASLRKKIMSYLMASIILNHEGRMVNDYVKKRLLKEAEGEHHNEHIERTLELLHNERDLIRNKTYFSQVSYFQL